MLELILLGALVILIVVIFRPVTRALFGLLDGHASKIRHELDEAKRLHEQAQSLLAEYQRQLERGEGQARTIVDHARAEAQRMTERHQGDLETALRRRTELVQSRIAQAEARAVQELRAQAARLAMRTTERLLRQQIDDARAAQLVDQAIGEVRAKLV
jgi:F-type H+-transporting ATPase subunit b